MTLPRFGSSATGGSPMYEREKAALEILCEGISYKQAAHHLGVPVSTVVKDVRRIRNLSAKWIKDMESESGEDDAGTSTG